MKTSTALQILIFLCAFLPTTVFGGEEIPLASVKSWGIQLQKVSLATIRNSPHDLIVIEPFSSPDTSTTFSKIQVELMKNKGNVERKKLLIAYLSIGEAEDYRSYWKQEWKTHPPKWLGKENRDWKGNYKVRYWSPEWQELLLAELDKILAAGFDGIYMDIVDAYWYWGDEKTYNSGLETYQSGDRKKDHVWTAEKMIEWISNIAAYSRINAPHANEKFLIFPQNGEGVLGYASEGKKDEYWRSIDGIGIEDLFHFGPAAEDNARNVEEYRFQYLNEFPKRNKRVLSIEYLTRQEEIAKFYQEARSHQFHPYATTRMLDRLFDPFSD